MYQILYWVLVGVGAVAALFFYMFLWKRYHYTCPKCHAAFKPGLSQSALTVKAGQHRLLKCPYCHAVNYLETQRDEK